jgi:hypothetical protein
MMHRMGIEKLTCVSTAMRKVLLNALNIRLGGGLQKVSSFLHSLSKEHDFRERYLVVTSRGGVNDDEADAFICHARRNPV